jgi:hypothetical protein
MPEWLVELTLPDGSDCENLLYLFLTLNFGYIIYIYSFIKIELINFLINTFNFIFLNELLNYDMVIYNLGLILTKNGYEDLFFFYCLKSTEFNIAYKI